MDLERYEVRQELLLKIARMKVREGVELSREEKEAWDRWVDLRLLEIERRKK